MGNFKSPTEPPQPVPRMPAHLRGVYNCSMTIITIAEIERDPVGCLHRVEAGESLLIMRGDHAIAELKPIEQKPRELRPFGLAAGQFVVPDDFDDPLPEEILKDFEGG